LTVPYTPRPDRLRRLRQEREDEAKEIAARNRTASAEAVASGERHAAMAAAIDEGFRHAGEPQHDPFFQTAPDKPISRPRARPKEVSAIPADREADFQSWVERNRITDLDHPDSHYDYRGAYLAGVDRGEAGHWPDTFKQHGHPTFSVESQYAQPGDTEAGHWDGEHFIPAPRRARPAVEAPPSPRVPVRPLGPTPREGMRPSRRAPAAESADPYAQESQLARTLSQIRYQSALTPVFGLGQTTAKILRTAEGLAGKIPVVGAPFRALEQDLDERIRRDEAAESVVRERYMSPAERIAQDLARFGVEFETAGRILPILKAAPAARAVPEGASFLAREAASAARLGSRAATEAAQFGTFEAGRSLATGESSEEIARHTTEGTLAGAIFGAGVPAVGSVAKGILRPVVEGVTAVPGAIRETARRGAQDALVADAMVRDAAAKFMERVRAVRERATAAGKPEVAQSLDAIAAEASELSALKRRTPRQRARLRVLTEQLNASEAELPPPARTAEEVAQAAEPEPALPSDIGERERRRHQVPVETERRVAPEAPAGVPEPLPVAPEPRPAEEGTRAAPEAQEPLPVPPTGAQEAPAPAPAAEPPRRRGKKATPEQLEAAFQRGRGENALQTLGGVQRAVAESGIPVATDLTGNVGRKAAVRGRLRDDALAFEVRDRFGAVLDRPEYSDPTKAPQTLAETVRAMDELLANREHGNYDVSRYGEGNISRTVLPSEFYEETWKEGHAPTPGDLRDKMGFGRTVDQTLRRLETASARAARDADIVEALGAGKDAPGVRAARQVATDLANQKVQLEQQVERAITASERASSEAARGRAGALNRDLSKAKIRPSDWSGNSMAEGEWVTDGHVMFRRADVDRLPAKRAEFYLKENPLRKGIAQEAANGMFKRAVDQAEAKLEILGHLPPGTETEIPSAYLVPEGGTTGLRRVNAALLRRFQEITKFDELRGPTGKSATERAIAAYRDGEPVGLIMPMRMPDVHPFSIEEARALSGQAFPPPKRPGGTTKVAGLTVREPLTARTPMEPNFEQPLASASLPATGVHEMATPAGKGPDIAAARARIVRKMSEILDIPVRIGKYGGFKRGALGVYKIKPEAIRLKVAKDIEVLGHEVGHHIHNLFFGMSGNALRPWWKELKPLGKGISDQSSSEGLAEFFRRYLTNPKEAETAAPTFYQYVEERLAKEFPEVRNMFEDARAAYKVYLEAGPRARHRSNISKQPEKHWSFHDKFRRFLADAVDDMYDVEKAQHGIISSALGLDAPPLWRPFARAKWMAEVSRQTKWEENAAALAHLVRGSAGTAEHFVKRGTLDYNTLRVKGKSLEAVLRPVSKQFDEFLDYAVARRANELHGRGIETGFRPEDTKWILEQDGAREHFVRGFDDLQVYQQHLLEYLRDARVISGDSYERILAQNEHYLPFYRVLDDEIARRGGGSVFGKLFSPVKRIKGSGRDIINPFESIIKNTYLYTRLAARQRVSQALAKLAEREGAGEWIERIQTPTAVTKFSFGEIENQIGKILGERMDLEGMTAKQRQALAEEMLAVYRPGDYFGKDNIISVLRGDKRVWYEVEPNLYKAMMGLSHEQAGSLTRLLTFPAKALRIGATLSLEFIGRNPIRDQLAAFVQSEYGFKPGFDWARGLFHMVKRDDLFWKWKAAGGERAALLELDRNSLAKSVRDVLGRPPGAGEVLKDVIKSPIELLKLLSAAAEDATRIGEFARGVEREGTTRAGLEKAASASREVSVDFARHGAKTEAIRMMTAFWNARLQGYYRLARSMRDHPVRTTARAGVAITIPSTLLFYANKDDPEYWAKPQWERDLFWHVKIRGTYYKIPKPFELGIIFGTIPERILEWAHTNDPKGLHDTLTQTIGSDVSSLVPIPTTLVPLVENFANWSLFKRQPVASRALEEVQPAFQYTEGTSEIAKGLARFLQLESGTIRGKLFGSPQKIDNLLFGWTGGLGRMAVDMGEVGGQQVGLFPEGERPAKTAADIPGVRGFISRPAGRGSEDVERFYQIWTQANEAKRTDDLLRRERRYEERDRFRDENDELLQQYRELQHFADRLASLRRRTAKVSRDETLSPDERRIETERLGSEMQQVAAEAIQRRTPVSQP
jgi:hypothetical protein